MTKSLPSSPSLQHLKDEAKSLLKAHKKGDPTCCSILKHIRRFEKKTDQDILGAVVSLQEIQFALAMEYGFKSWAELKARVEIQGSEVSAVQTNKDVFRRYTEAANNHDAETMRSLVTDHCVIHYDEKITAHEDMLQQQIQWWQECPPYRQYEIVEMIAEGDRVAVRMIGYGKETNGKVSRQNFSFGVRFEKGSIAEFWHDMRTGYEREGHQDALSLLTQGAIGQNSGASEERAKVEEKQVKVEPDYSKLQLKADDHARDSFSLTMQAVARMYGIDVDYETVYGLSGNGFAPGIHPPEDCRQLQRMHDRGRNLDIVAARLGLVLRTLDLDFRRNTTPWLAIREALQRGEVVVTSGGWLDAPYTWWGIILEAPENGPVNAIRGATQNGRKDSRLDHTPRTCWAITLGKPTLTPEQADIAMLQRAVARIRGDKEPFLLGDDQVVYGLKAMELWIADMRKPAFQASDPASSMGNAANCALYSCEGARDTCSYLRRRLMTFPEDARSHIDAAADQYDFIWRTLAPFAVCPGGYATVIGDQARQNEHADKVLVPCKDAMAKAADEIEKVLAAMK